MTEYRVCSRCIMDTSDPDISFDSSGHCNHCAAFFSRLLMRPTAEHDAALLAHLVEKMKRRGFRKEYDCILGLSGGCDSSYLAFKVVELGLRPLALHFDSGWNTETSAQNLERVVKALKLDLHTVVCVWDEMRDLQRSFFKAALVNCDIPQDHAFIATLYQMAARFGAKYWVSGHDYWGSESIMARAWRGYDSRDWRHIRTVHERMGGKKLRYYPHLELLDQVFWYPAIRRIRSVNVFHYLRYNKVAAREFLKGEIGWKDYTGKHNESMLTRFFQGYYLPTKFGFDKRRAHLSSLVVSGQMSREDALEEIASPFYSPEALRQDRDFVLKKLGFSTEEWKAIMGSRGRTELDFPSNRKVYARLENLMVVGSRLKRILRMGPHRRVERSTPT